MAYVAIADIRDSVKSLKLEVDDDLTDEKINKFIVQEEDLINAQILTKYTLPIPRTGQGPLKTISLYKVLVRIGAFLKITTGNDEFTQTVINDKHFFKEAKNLIMMLKDNSLILPGVEPKKQTYSHFGDSEFSPDKLPAW